MLKHTIISIKNKCIDTLNLYRFYMPMISFFLPMDQFFLLGGLACLLIVLDIKTFYKTIRYKQNYVLYLFTLLNIILAYINDNTLGLIASFFLVLVTIYTTYLRMTLTRKRFEIITIIIGLGSILSLYYTTIDFYSTTTYQLYYFFMDYIHLPYSFVTGIAEGVRSNSTYINPNYYGHISSFIALISLYQVLNKIKTLKEKPLSSLILIFFFITIIAVNLVGLGLSQSRSAFIGLIIGSLFLLLASHHFYLFVLGLLFYIFRQNDINLFLDYFPRIELIGPSAELRIDIYLATIAEIKENIFFGKGLYTYPLIYKKYQVPYFPHSHNFILEALLDTGLVGTLLFLYHFIKPLIKPIKTWIQSDQSYVPLVISVLAFQMANGFTDAVIVFPQTFLLLSFVIFSVEINNETL